MDLDFTKKMDLEQLVTICREKNKNQVDWYVISVCQKLSEGFIREFKDQVNWVLISKYQHLSEDFIREFKDRVDWERVSEYQHLPEDFIREFKDRVDWNYILVYQHLSEDFIREFKDRVDWYNISVYQKLSEGFIREFKDWVDWDAISEYQHLPEDFIREFKDWVDWECVSACQHLSEDFIREFKDWVNWHNISLYQKLSEDFKKEFCSKLFLDFIENSWYYVSDADKKAAVQDTGLYECHEDYFIAYKGIRSDRYSKFNFQYQYLPEKTYETHADYSEDENSFGFSVWDKENARNYCPELVVTCKVYYKDVARVVHLGGKIRCSKITILN